MHDNI